jgi:23S rRNA (guanosine2251-2'-O)-methyltransferase
MEKNINYEYISGINPVYSLLTRNAGSRKIYQIILNQKRKKDSRIQNILDEARKKNIDIVEFELTRFDSISPEDINSQGICARVSPYNYNNLEQYLSKEAGSKSKLIVLDGVTDVGNFGSIIRNCNAFDFEGIIIPERRSVALNERVSKISAGALEEVRVFRVVNIVRTLKELKDRGFWVYGTTLDITPEVKYLDEIDFTFPLALVLGSEDRGIGRLIGANCDIMISIKLAGRMQSLNVSVASGIILYKVQEQIEKTK